MRRLACAALAAAAVMGAGCGAVPGGPASAPPATAAAPAAETARPPAATPAAATPAAPASPAPVSAATAPAVAATAAAAPAPPPPPILPFDEAVLSAANALLGRAQLTPGQPAPHALVIDPLIDGVTGVQNAATQAMGARIVELVRQRYAQQYDIQPFTTGAVAKSPLVLVGTFTGVNKERKTEGAREAYRICLALADLKTGKLVSKGLAFARPDGVDPTPAAFFRDAPALAEDPATLGYIRTCQGTRVGDPIHPMYVDRIVAATMINEAMEAYAAGRYKDALALYESVAAAPAGDQLRTYTGLYLSNWRLGRREAAAKAFGTIVDKGLESKRLGLKFLFRPATTAFWSDPRAGADAYPTWLSQLASQTGRRASCLEVVGHTSATGPEPLNERLSLRRAEYVKGQLERTAPALAKRLMASGAGSREMLVGNGRDDASDALDRRVEFKVVGC